MLTVAFLLALTAGFVAIAVLSYEMAPGRRDRPTVEPAAAGAGRASEETVFDYTEDACSPIDIPDAPARAFRDADGQVHLIASHYVDARDGRAQPGHGAPRLPARDGLGPRRRPGPLRRPRNGSRRRTPPTAARSTRSCTTSTRATSTRDAVRPSEYLKCWYNSITLARSTDGGRTFRHAPPPRHLVASVPYRYEPDAGPFGLFQPSNIVRNGRGRLLLRAGPRRGVQARSGTARA